MLLVTVSLTYASRAWYLGFPACHLDCQTRMIVSIVLRPVLGDCEECSLSASDIPKISSLGQKGVVTIVPFCFSPSSVAVVLGIIGST